MKNLQIKKVSIFYVSIILFCGLLTSGAVFALSEDVDFLGTPRPQGDFIDLGAFEYVDTDSIPDQEPDPGDEPEPDPNPGADGSGEDNSNSGCFLDLL